MDHRVEVSFREAIKIAKEQKSVSLGKRAVGTYAEYRRQKAILPVTELRAPAGLHRSIEEPGR